MGRKEQKGVLDQLEWNLYTKIWGYAGLVPTSGVLWLADQITKQGTGTVTILT
jgi:hypothetical protein